MTALLDVDDIGVVDNRPDVAVGLRYLRETQEAIEVRNDIGVNLNLRNELLHILHKLVEKLRLEDDNLLVGAQDLLLVFLQFGRYVSLSLSQCLLANPVGRNLILKGVAHFKVIAEDVVVAHLQRTDARLLRLTLLNLQEILLSVVPDGAEVVEFG